MVDKRPFSRPTEKINPRDSKAGVSQDDVLQFLTKETKGAEIGDGKKTNSLALENIEKKYKSALKKLEGGSQITQVSQRLEIDTQYKGHQAEIQNAYDQYRSTLDGHFEKHASKNPFARALVAAVTNERGKNARQTEADFKAKMDNMMTRHIREWDRLESRQQGDRDKENPFRADATQERLPEQNIQQPYQSAQRELAGGDQATQITSQEQERAAKGDPFSDAYAVDEDE